jgi:ribosomal protein S16
MIDQADHLSSEDSEGAIDPEAVASRADGRPAEEESSDNPEAQARAILEESEQRIADGAQTSDPIDELIPKPSDGQLEEERAD